MAYPHWWTDTVTIFHKSVSSGKIIWTGTQYSGAFFRRVIQTTTGERAMRKGDNAFCRLRTPIPTVDVGDIVYKGASSATISEYVAGSRASDFVKANGPNTFVIDTIRDNTHEYTHSPHLYVGSK